ncbi:MAG: hypothetical protein ABUT20_41000 [Bacteroidota bacterium]
MIYKDQTAITVVILYLFQVHPHITALSGLPGNLSVNKAVYHVDQKALFYNYPAHAKRSKFDLIAAMKKKILYMVIGLMLTGCQHSLHFPDTPAVIVPNEKLTTAIVVTNPTQADYDSMVFRYSADRTREVHFSAHGDSVTRTYYYDAAGRLSALEDEKAIYYTNNNMARRISFIYDAGGRLQQTKTDFTGVQGVTAYIVNATGANGKQMIIIYDTSYIGASYNLDWTNRIIYNTISNNNALLYDSAIFVNTSAIGLVKTIVNEYNYGADSSVNTINRRIYFNHQLSEYGTVIAQSDHAAPVYKALHKKLYRNLSNWFDESSVWQDDNYHIFPLQAGPYKSILYTGYSASSGAAPSSYTRNYEFNNSFSGDQLDKSVIDYSLIGQGSSKYTYILRFYYKE